MINEKYSFKDFSDKSLKHHDPSEFSNTTIVGSCFCHEIIGETPMEIDTFPDGTKDVTFERCNLINVALPKNSICDKDCSVQRMLAQGLTDINVDKHEVLSKVKPLKVTRAELIQLHPTHRQKGEI